MRTLECHFTDDEGSQPQLDTRAMLAKKTNREVNLDDSLDGQKKAAAWISKSQTSSKQLPRRRRGKSYQLV